MRKRVHLRNTNDEDILVGFTFKQAFDYFYSAKKSEEMRKTTLITYTEHFNFFMSWLKNSSYDITLVSELSVQVVRDYINYMRENHYNFKSKVNGLSSQTINARIRFLKTWYSFLEKDKLIADNIMFSINYLKVDEKKSNLLTEKEMKILLNTPDKRFMSQWRDLVIMFVLYDSALRISEAISLNQSDIDIVRRQIILPGEKAKDRRIRVVPISNHTIKLLIKLIDENNKNFPNCNGVFLNWFGERMAVDTFRRNLKRYVAKAGITKEFSCHDFRRQSVTEMLKNGASVFAVQRIAGHSQISTTKRYVHFDEDVIREQHDLYSPINKLKF
ncbi:tyrosine-type recombinase/integrase [Psychrobacillus sp. L3]|uniref:tyrosine-type recombinase/integrase n=1 Tax=Psychrobacillus sp. L3 TaxID=3236891 RepID=UPI0036F359F3